MKLYSYYFVVIFIAVISKIFFFYEFSTINDDDLRYIRISNAIFEGFNYSIITNIDHIAFPPGYPLVIGIEKFFLKTWENVYLFNFLLLSTLISYFAYVIFKRFFSNNNTLFLFPIFFLYPFLISSRSVFSTSTVIIFTFLIILGVFYLFKFFYETKNVFYLYVCNFLLAFAYLVRPEGIYFFSIIVLFQIYKLRLSVVNFKYLFSILIPAICFVFSYIIFIYIETGVLTFTYKPSIYDYSIHRGNFIENTSKLINIFFLTPHLFNPVMLLGLLLLIFNLFFFSYKKENKEKIYFLFGIPLIFIFLLAYKYALIGRVLYSTIPFFLILSSLGIQKVMPDSKFIKYLLSAFIIVFFVFSYSLLLTQNIFSNHPILYKKAANFLIKEDNSLFCVAGRDLKLFHYLNDNKLMLIHGSTYLMVNSDHEERCEPKYIILSNLNHISLRTISELEEKYFDNEEFLYNKKNYKKYKIFNRNNYTVKIFKHEDL